MKQKKNPIHNCEKKPSQNVQDGNTKKKKKMTNSWCIPLKS